jgi:hypothetical protein
MTENEKVYSTFPERMSSFSRERFTRRERKKNTKKIAKENRPMRAGRKDTKKFPVRGLACCR